MPVLLRLPFLLALWAGPALSDPLRVGAIYGLSGPLASFGEEYRNSALLAAEASKGGVQLFFEDSPWEPKTAVSAFQKLSTVDKVRVFHVMGAGMSLAVKPLSEKGRCLLFSAAAHPALRLAGGSRAAHGSRKPTNNNDLSLQCASADCAVVEKGCVIPAVSRGLHAGVGLIPAFRL